MKAQLNCKAGDLAVFIKSRAGNTGKIVTCIRLASFQELIDNNITTGYGPVWIINRKVNIANLIDGRIIGKGQPKTFALDSQLRPIRDQEGEDEILTVAGKPVKEMDTV